MSWWADRPMRVKLSALVVAGTAGMLVVGGLGVGALGEAGERTDVLLQTTTATGLALEADMMHDAVRADVLQSLLAGRGPLYEAAVADLADHSATLRDTLEGVAGAGLGPGVDAAVTEVSPAVEGYLGAAATIVAQAGSDAATAQASYPAFLTAFVQLEEALPVVGEAVATEAQAAVDASAEERADATWLIAAVGGLGLLALVVLGEMVTRSVVRPLGRVRAVVDALADGDMRQSTGVHSRDEVGLIAEAVDRSVADLRALVSGIGDASASLAAATGQLAATAHGVVELAGDSSSRSAVVSDAADQVSRNIQTVAAGSSEMGTAVREIAQNAAQVAMVAADAVRTADATTATVSKLGDSSLEIAGVVKTITAIAEQTNLLALNATIEAARAGDAGKGFAVVANEVKELAQETATATKDITQRVEAIRADTAGAVQAIAEISAVIARINDAQGSIAAAVEQQTATVAEMDRNVADAARGADRIAATIASAAAGAGSTATGMAEAGQSIGSVAGMAAELRAAVARFRV